MRLTTDATVEYIIYTAVAASSSGSYIDERDTRGVCLRMRILRICSVARAPYFALTNSVFK